MSDPLREIEGAAQPDIALRRAISMVSQAALCASWDADTEFAVWAMAEGERRCWLDASLDDPKVAALIAEIRRLADSTRLWWMHSGDGLVAVPLEQWRRIYSHYAGHG